jgi:hypothetical protein
VVGFRSLVSTHTRHSPHWAESIGWFTAIAPFAVEYPADRELIDVLALANESWATAKRGAGLPMPRISDLLDAPLQPRFVLSYLDARFNSSADRWDDWKAHALIGDVGPTDEVYAWINRMPTETYLTWRFPGNEVCGAEVEAVTKLMAQIILETLSLGSEPIRTPSKAARNGSDGTSQRPPPHRAGRWWIGRPARQPSTPWPWRHRPGVIPSMMQAAHLALAKSKTREGYTDSSWLCVAFELPGQFDVDAWTRTINFWLGRHGGMRNWFTADGDSEGHADRASRVGT